MSQAEQEKGPMGLISRVLRYLELRLDYSLLQAQTLGKHLLSTFWIGLAFFMLGTVCITFMGLALALALNQWLNNLGLAFFIIGLLFILFLLALFGLRSRLEKMILNLLDTYIMALTLKADQPPNPNDTSDAQSTLSTRRDAPNGKRNEELSGQHRA
jgi:hypothetical protein